MKGENRRSDAITGKRPRCSLSFPKQLTSITLPLRGVGAKSGAGQPQFIHGPRHTSNPKLLARCIALVGVTFWSLSAGAGVTIKTVVAYDPLACGQFLAMVTAAGIPEMSDAQLCDFRFERLSPSIAKHFVAIEWKPLEVKDSVAMYRRMWQSHVIKGYAYNLHLGPDLINAAREAATDHNLGFYTAQVQLLGRGPKVTVVKMDVLKGCTKLPWYVQHMGIPFYALYKDSKLQHPLPIKPVPDNWMQMMLWQNEGLFVPVLLKIQPFWGAPMRPQPAYFNQATLNSLVPAKVRDGIY